MPIRNLGKQAENYFYQEYKDAFPNIEYAKVMKFLRMADLATIGMVVKDIDVTIDYAGSFDMSEVIKYLTDNEDFRKQGSYLQASRTVYMFEHSMQ